MLLAGDLDAVLPRDRRHRSSAAIRAYAGSSATLAPSRRLCGENRHFPIMHVVAMRREIYERDRWLAMSLFKAFDEARRRSLARAADMAASYFPLPWIPDELRRARELFGDDPWPYGVEANRPTLDAFLRYAFEQGVCRRELSPDALFPPEVREAFRI